MKKIWLVLVLLIIGEIFFGFVFFLKDVRHQLIHLEDTIDYPYLYFSFKPDESEFINEDGLYTKRGRTKTEKYRIILTGGSVARCSGAPYSKTIASCLEQELNKRFKDIEVINAGMSGYVLEQEFIFIQLVLQYYKPDMIIGLDGYNDLISFKLNRYSDFAYSPQNWRDFKVIQKGKEEKKPYYRFKVLFRNIFRVIDFVKRLAKHQSAYDYGNITDGQLEEASQNYIRILNDMHDFCASKNIQFYSFLQPVKWYIPEGPEYARFDKIPQLAKLYRNYDRKIRDLSYGFSLTNIFENNLEIYTDDCHVEPQGNSVFAKAMAGFLEKRLAEEMEKRPDAERIISYEQIINY